MESTSDNRGEYRARAAACRAMAEKAAEFPSETRTWIQIAEMWEGLAERADGQAPGAVAVAATATATEGAEVAEGAEPRRDDDLSDAAWVPHPGAASATASAEGRKRAAPERGPLRRAAVVAGFLLLPVLAVAAFWPGGDKPAATVVAERPAPAPAWSEPAVPASRTPEPRAREPALAKAPALAPPPSPAPAPALAPPPSPAPAAQLAAAPQPGPSAQLSAAAQPAAAPEPAAPRPPAPERVAEAAAVPPNDEAMSETGSVGQRPEPPPEAGAAAPAGPAPSRPKLAALPSGQPLQARASEPPPEPAAAREKLTGTWWPTACPKARERKNAVRMVLAENRAKAGAASCTFLKKTQSGDAWTVVAKCSDGTSSWTANIRLVLEGKRLQWASERGTQTYHRCG